MKAHTFSIVVGDARCNAKCPFCIAKMTASDFSDYVEFDAGRFNIACRIVDQMRDGLLTVLLTGQGEPLLFPKQITRYIDCINFRFPLIELQTNGTLVEKNLDNFRLWRDEGLTLVRLSVTSHDHKVSNSIMGIEGDRYNYWRTAAMLQEIGLNVQLNCTMTKAGTHRPESCETLIIRANNAGILQMTFREVEMPTSCIDSRIGDWVTKHKPHGAAKKLHHFLAMNGAVELLRLPGGGMVYDYHDQNVAIGNCLTETTNPDDIRQVIFFPDNRVAYSWQYKAARLL
jgi:molybdenum cofactor biosynthesis enzyme MoaA